MPSADRQTPPRDPLLALIAQIAIDRKRLKGRADALPKEDPLRRVYDEVEGTVLSFLNDVVVQLGQVRNWTGQSLEDLELRTKDALGELHDRIPGDDETQITVEDAQKLDFVITACRRLAELSRDASTDATEKESLTKILTACDECDTILEESVLTEDSEEGDGEDEEAEGIPAAIGQA